ADKILLSPLDITRSIPKSTEIPSLRKILMGLPMIIGDKVQVALFGTRPQTFIIEGARPRGALIMNPHTEIAFKEPDVDYAEAIRVSYEEIGGLEEELGLIKEMIEIPLKFPDLFTLLGIEPPKGVLISGPPGTGKTLIARAISSEVRAHFIHVNGPEVIHKFYGASEAKLREVFEEARRNVPSIIFFDEIDALAPKRAQVVGDVEKRVVAQLLALMDGLVARGEVVIIGATNMPELVDPALRRPGRFDREIKLGVPSQSGRLKILKIHSRKMPLAPDVDMERQAEITHGYVGADLAALCREAGMAALRRIMPGIKYDMDQKPDLADDVEIKVTAEDFF
ncbi:MAG: AAA family ATPase, partial [Anaerolineales bacterium]|nr:AAA family ATPase [Anaerolineales bacterium]